MCNKLVETCYGMCYVALAGRVFLFQSATPRSKKEIGSPKRQKSSLYNGCAQSPLPHIQASLRFCNFAAFCEKHIRTPLICYTLNQLFSLYNPNIKKTCQRRSPPSKFFVVKVVCDPRKKISAGLAYQNLNNI